MNEEAWKKYARILIETGLALRAGQPLYIAGGTAHRRLMAHLTEAAYEAGSGRVEHKFFDPLQEAALIRRGRLEDVELFHVEEERWLSEAVRAGAALLLLRGTECPELFTRLAEEHPERYLAFRRARSAASVGFFRHAIDRRRCPWLIAPCPTRDWARQVFPDLAIENAFDELTAWIFRFLHVDRDAAGERLAAGAEQLEARARALDARRLTEIHVQGGGNDLRLSLTPRSRWLGGRQSTTAGQLFHPNLPSFEVYTTPDARTTEGRLVASLDFRLPAGPTVRGLVLRFTAGRVVDFEAREGAEAFARWLETDAGARRLGEFALVGEDSPIARSGIYFHFTPLDENAAAHVALGKSYSSAIDGGDDLPAERLEALGCNASKVHLDVPFGAPEVTVTGRGKGGLETVLLEAGRWVLERRDLERRDLERRDLESAGVAGAICAAAS